MITLVVNLLFLLVRIPLLRLFSQDESVLMYADRYVTVGLLGQWIYAIFNALICIVNGVGMVRYTMVVNLLMLWAVRIPCAYMIRTWFDGTWIMLSVPISFAFGLCSMIGFCMFSRKWKEIIQRPVGAS